MASRPLRRSSLGRLFALTSLRRRAGLLLMLLTAGSMAMAASPFAAAASGPRDSDDTRFVQTNIVSDVPGWAPIVDASLVNAWGMSAGPATPVWVSNNGTDSTTLYKGGTLGVPFSKVPLTVAIPDGAPTGQVFNPGTDFMVGGAPAKFIFASEHGFIDAWQGGLSPVTMAMNVATVPGAEYKGLAISTGTGGSWLYAANFAAGRIDVFNGAFALQSWAGAFMDPHLAAGYAPFNIQNLGGRLYVTYAKRGPTGDDVKGAGHGYVDVYDTSGHFIKRLVSHGRLNSPWGLQIAPAGFGAFSGDLLVGNFGDGRINAYNPWNGAPEGTLRGSNGRPIWIDGLWGLQFGNGVAGTPTTLLFTAGPGGEAHGLFGSLDLAPDLDD
ncbi:MAG TPA: TIGR03118 family protein [Candidatus Limnocylindrales bacterium]